MADLNFDFLNVYVNSKIPTNRYLKAFLLVFNIGLIIGLFWFAIALQDDKPNVLPFLFPILFFLTLGKYFLWNIFGEEFYIISSTHISYQHDYGFWKTKLKTDKYSFIAIDNTSIDIPDDEEVRLIFIAYTPEKLQNEIFTTAISIKYYDAQRIFNRLNELKIDEFGEEVSFPKIYSN